MIVSPEDEIQAEADARGVKLIGFNRGGLSFRSETLHVCAVCWHQTEATFVASSVTHRILNRSMNPVTDIGLCVRCWSELLREST